MSDPLNLQAVENWIAELEKLHTVRAAYYGEERLLKQDITFAKALLAHCRALRAALHDYMRRTGDGLCRDRHAVARNDAATVLAQAVDGEAAP